jgi:hypothetical protein
MGEGNAIFAWQFKDANCMWGQSVILALWALNSLYLWEAKMLNPYIKHGTFLVKFDDHIKTIRGEWFP